jgi:type IV secretion system protein VirB4
MQLLPPLTPDPRVVAREQSAGVHLPYARHVDDVTLETRDGLLMQTIRLGGLLFETADTEELNYRAELRDAMLKAVGSSRFALYHHVVRRRADAVLEARFPDEFSRNLDARWRERLATREMYVNELFLTLVRRPTPGRAGILDRLRNLATRTTTDRAATFAAEKRAMDAATEALMASLGSYSPRILSVYEGEDGHRSEPLEFLSWLYNAISAITCRFGASALARKHSNWVRPAIWVANLVPWSRSRTIRRRPCRGCSTNCTGCHSK